MPISIAKKNTSAGKSGNTPSFLKTGGAANAALKEEAAKAELSQADRNKPWRFYIPKTECGTDFQITFLDGELEKDGTLRLVSWSEHMIQIAGDWKNIVCLAPDYCPVCAKDNQPRLVCAFTIVDHTPRTIKKGPREGEVVKNQRKLLVVSRNQLGVLQKHASKHDGLRGMQFEVSRTNQKAASIGDVWIPQQKFSDAELKESLGKDTDGNRMDLPFDYADVAPYYPAEQLEEMGFGSNSNTLGNEPMDDLSSKL